MPGIVMTSDLGRVRMLLLNWVAWQNSAHGYRLNLKTANGEGGIIEVDVGEAQLCERIMLRLKAINRDHYDAVTAYYTEHEAPARDIAKRLGVGERTLRERRTLGEYFIAGSLEFSP